jgi:hypothetical protein
VYYRGCYDQGVQLKFELLADVLRVEIRDRETAAETREAVEQTLAEREKHGALGLSIIVKNSRALFKVEEYGLSQHLGRVAPRTRRCIPRTSTSS